MNKRNILMSPADSKLFDFFKKQFNVISSDYLEDYISFERYHADMQALRIADKLFINSACKKLIKTLEEIGLNYTLCDGIEPKYPKNVALNASLIGDNIICNEKALHPKVKEYCLNSGIKIINVKQGYTKCSILALNENSIITDDESIAKALLINNINVLKIEKGDICLDSVNVGFIGGASSRIGDTVYFFGDINRHRDSSEIIKFIDDASLNIECITDNQLIDIGGIVLLD